MPLEKHESRTRSLLDRVIALPDLARTVRALPAQTFAALVREVGVEDAGELLALATADQLVRAFDEDLFVGARAGERETFDVDRFVVWLEVLLEAGDERAAARFAELDEDFVAHALSGVILVLAETTLRERIEDADEDERARAEKGLESALVEDLDGYVVVARRHLGWDAALALLLALDRDHRALLERLLERLAHLGERRLAEGDGLSSLLSESESLADDVEAAREERRARQGFVEPQAARAFLTLARRPFVRDDPSASRDPMTKAYLRDVERAHHAPAPAPHEEVALRALPPALLRELEASSVEISGPSPSAFTERAFMEALRELGSVDPAVFTQRMEELAYLANVLVAGHERGGARLRPREATEAALATVSYGAALEIRGGRAPERRGDPVTASELTALLRHREADVLFRVASSALAGDANEGGVLYSAEEVEEALRVNR